MGQKSQGLGVQLALVPLLILLSMTLVDSNPNVCQKCSKGSDPLNKTKLKIIMMSQDTQDLYNSYLTHENLLDVSHQFCNVAPVPWFPNRNINRAPESSMLQDLHKTLIYLDDYFAGLLMQQQERRQPTEPALFKKMENASLSVKGLLYNVQCALCIRGLVPDSVTPPGRTLHTSDFYRKIDGCRLLSSYSNFIRNLARAFNRQAGKRKRRRSGRGMAQISG
ncbi:leukemia inhibitory factor-like [Elgaria multicarinata webbii]|uniref:leukemia inhibitory factor-like n=1 Tax=Elgaria multicarinata webbii TaxID=159646 RepID=UPI002FCD5136